MFELSISAFTTAAIWASIAAGIGFLTLLVLIWFGVQLPRILWKVPVIVALIAFLAVIIPAGHGVRKSRYDTPAGPEIVAPRTRSAVEKRNKEIVEEKDKESDEHWREEDKRLREESDDYFKDLLK